MKNKYIKKLLIFLLIISIMINPMSIYARDVTYYENQQKGDLSCPDGKSSTKCKMYDASGRELSTASHDVHEVRVTETKGDIEVTKIVKKTNTLSKFSVQFSVKGQNEVAQTIKKENYIVIIRDASTSLTNNQLTASTAAIQSFVTRLSNETDANYYFALIQFGYDLAAASKTETFHKNSLASNVFFCPRDSKDTRCNQGTASNIDYAITKAKALLTGKADDLKKWVIIVGDGRYWLDTDLSGRKQPYQNAVYPALLELRKLNPIIRGVYYEASYNKNNKLGRKIYRKSKKDILCSDKKTLGWCDKTIMSDMTGGVYSVAANDTDWTTIFTELASSISSSVVTTSTAISGSLVDTTGSQFTLNTNERSKTLNFDRINKTPTTSPAFEININTAAVKGWHNTNNGFTLTVGTDVITSRINPEVYWEPETVIFSNCSESITKTITSMQENPYYNEYCEEGWGSTRGLSASLSINNLPNGKSFSIEKGFGFPASLSLESNVRCTYTFNLDNYKSDFLEMQQKYINAKDNKEKNWYLTEINTMKAILNNYNNIVKGSALLNYKTRFDSQNAIMNVKYKNSNVSEDVNLINSNTNYGNPSCSNTNTVNIGINGLVNTVNSVCTISLKKVFILPKVCLNMRTGDAELCSSGSNIQLIGGNKYYTKMDETGGYVSIKVPDAGFFSTNIKLEGEQKNDKLNNNCSFTIYDKLTSKKENLKFRQIDVKDPFIQGEIYSSVNKREIGSNYFNEKYNFVKVIDSNIWSKNYEYLYRLSKTNIKNIKNSTIGSNEKVSSYLGSNCYIKKETNTYICPFDWNTSEAGGSNEGFFSYFDIKN